MLYDFNKAKKPASTMGPAPSAPSPIGPTPTGYAMGSTAKAHGSTFNDNGRTLYYDSKSGAYMSDAEWKRLNSPAPAPVPKATGAMAKSATAPGAAPTTTGSPLQTATQNLGESPFKSLKVDWTGYQANEESAMRRRLTAEADAAREAARKNAARRGLLSGGDSGIYQGMLTDIDQQQLGQTMAGQNEIARSVGAMSKDYDMRLAGAEAGWRMGVPAALSTAMMLPGAMSLQAEQIRGAGIGNDANAYQHYAMTQRLPIELGNLAALGDATRANIAGQTVQTQAAQYQLDEAIQTTPQRRAEAETRLKLLQVQIANAQRAGDYALADELGGIAARVAKAGGFKWIGGALGGIAGSIIPGAGTAAGAGVGAGIGSALDAAFS